MPTHPRPDDWTYFKLYLGEAVDCCDGFLVALLPEIQKIRGVERVFFLRYLDEQGFHVRLRFQSESSRRTDVIEQARRKCETALWQLPLLPPSDYYPMVPPPSPFKSAKPGAEIGIVPDIYEPELDRFGGVRGMPIAEALFEASSRVAIEVLRLEAEGSLSRKTLGPCFMRAVSNAFPLGQSESDFWKDYSFFWLGSRSPAAMDLRERFFAKGDSLYRDEIPVVADLDRLPRLASSLVKDWSESVRQAANAYDRVANVVRLTPGVLAFHFAHLMNNRLGLYWLEEAYLAALLEQRALRLPAP